MFSSKIPGKVSVTTAAAAYASAPLAAGASRTQVVAKVAQTKFATTVDVKAAAATSLSAQRNPFTPRNLCSLSGDFMLMNSIDVIQRYLDTLSIIESYLEKTVANTHFSGVIMVVHHGEILLNQGYGMASADAENCSKTVIHVAAITKQFTAAAILLLQEAGKIDLDRSINCYLPVAYQSDWWKNVTVHHLLSHTGGVPDYATKRDYYDVRRGFCFGNTVSGMINETRSKKLEFEPGSAFYYSNIGYTILGVIIEKIADKSYSEFIKEKLLRPLGMFSSGIHEETHVEEWGDAKGHRYDEKQQKLVDDDGEINFPVTTPSDGLFTTTRDLLKWNNMISGKTTGVLSSEAIEMMTTPVKNTTTSNGRYGYGLFIDTSSGTTKIHHAGRIVGFRSHFCLYPEKEVYIAVLCNNTKANPVQISEGISEIILERLSTLNDKERGQA